MLIANLSESDVHLRFEMDGNIGASDFSYALGNELFNFLSFDMPEVYSLYVELAEAFMDYHYGAKDRGAYEEKLAALCGELDRRSTYLHWYTVDLLSHMTEYQAGSKMALDDFLLGYAVESHDIFKRLENLMEDNSLKPYFDLAFLDTIRGMKLTVDDMESRPLRVERELYRTELKMGRIDRKRPSKSVMKKAIGLAILAVADDLWRKRELFLGEVEAIIEGDAGLDGLTLTQKLYMLDVRRTARSENPLYDSNLWQTTFKPYPPLPYRLAHAEPKGVNEQEIKEYLLQNGVEVRKVHQIETMERLIIFELLALVTSGAVIKKCKYCGNYFVPQGRSDTVFCDRVAKGETKSCRLIGSLKLHKAEKTGNPIHEAHLKAYRRMNSKARTKRIPQGEFLAWSDEARAKRDACLNGELPFDEFQKWLDGDKER